MQARNSHRSEAMGRDSIWRLLLRFSGPSIVSMMVASSYNLIDAIFVGRLGTDALGALAIAFPLMMIFMAVAMGTGIGAASLISRSLGRGDRDGANRVAGITITLSVLIGALLTVVCLPNLEALLRLFGADASVLPLAKSYMSILATFAVVNLFCLIAGNIVRAEGNPILASAAMIISAVANIILDPVMIFGFGPIPAMGIAGAATATVVGRGIGGMILLFYLFSKRTSYQFQPSYFLPRLKVLVEIYRVGLASVVRMLAGSVVMVVANRVAVSFGVIPLAVRGVLFRASSFAFMPAFGLGQGALPLIGYNFAAGQRERVGEVVTKASLAAFIWSVLCWVVVMLFSTKLMAVFSNDPEFLAEGTPALRIFALAFFTVGVQMVLTYFFQGIGKGIPSLVMASARQIIFLLPGFLIFPLVFGINGLWMAFPVADALSFILALTWTSIEFRRQEIKFRLRHK